MHRIASPHVGAPPALAHRVPGLDLCGAATRPAGSVIAVNDRNAAMAVLGTPNSALELCKALRFAP